MTAANMASGNRRESGFTFLGLLFLIALMGIAMATTGVLWQQDAQRDRERELLFIGGQFRHAIALYYEKSPGMKRYPKSLEELLQDRRFVTKQRYLRRIYRDPMTGKAEWGLVHRPDGTITGVFSQSQQEPIKRANFHADEQAFKKAKSYTEWKFIYLPNTNRATQKRK